MNKMTQESCTDLWSISNSFKASLSKQCNQHPKLYTQNSKSSEKSVCQKESSISLLHNPLDLLSALQNSLDTYFILFSRVDAWQTICHWRCPPLHSSEWPDATSHAVFPVEVNSNQFPVWEVLQIFILFL